MMKVSLDTKEFDAALAEYTKFSKKAPSEIVNTKCYFIARNCTNTTPATTKEKIASDLNAPSRTNPNVPLAAILVNMNLRSKGQRGLSGSKMSSAVNKFIRARNRSINFLRAGWIPAVKLLSSILGADGKRGAPKLNARVKPKGKDKGRAIAAKPTGDRCFAEIENSVTGGDNPRDAQDLIQHGLNLGMKQEIASMQAYIKKKYDAAAAKFNKS